MRLLKKEKEALAALLEAGADTPETLAEMFVKKLDELRAERTHVFACAVVAGIPIAIGPLSTRNQAEKVVGKVGASRAWVVPGWTAEGWERHIKEVDEPPPEHETPQLKGGRFWGKVSEIREGAKTAIVGKTKQDIEIRRVATPGRGYWG